MRAFYEHLTLGIAAAFIAVMALNSCAAVSNEDVTDAMRKQADCMDVCSVADTPEVAAICITECLSE